MSEFRAASRYAKSLLELAAEKEVLEEVHNDMLSFDQLCKQSREFELMLKNPIIKNSKKRAILQDIFKGKVSDMTLAIFDIISKKNREPILPQIAKDFHRQYNLRKSIQEARVTTAVSLTDELKAQIERLVKEISGKDEVELTTLIDKDIIGGYILKVGDRQIDDSLKSKLKALELKFSQNPYIKEF